MKRYKYRLKNLVTGELTSYVGDDNTQTFLGEYGQCDEHGNPIYGWVENDPPTTEEKLNEIRIQRNQLLSESDFSQLPDVPLDASKKAEWAAYRQSLRDFPAKCDPENPVWPEKPV